MKLLAALLVTFIPLVGGAQSVGGGNSGGGLMKQRALTYGCEEGRVGSISLRNSEGKIYTEHRVCVNGSYMNEEERAAYIYNPRTRLCKEGSLTSFGGRTPDDTNIQVVHQCKNGKWVPLRRY